MKPNSLVTYQNARYLEADYRGGLRPRLIFARHALERFAAMKEQGLTADEVTCAVVTPDAVGYTRVHDAMLLTSRRVTLSVVIDPDGYPLVATILWATADAWRESYGKRPLDGREARSDLSHLS